MRHACAPDSQRRHAVRILAVPGLALRYFGLIFMLPSPGVASQDFGWVPRKICDSREGENAARKICHSIVIISNQALPDRS